MLHVSHGRLLGSRALLSLHDARGGTASSLVGGGSSRQVAIPSLFALVPERTIGAEVTIARDRRRPLIERLEAFQGIMEAELGDTSLSRVRNVEREVGLRQLYVKFEGCNPTGTHKDRIAFAQVMDALRRGFDTVTLATCGNYGAAVSRACGLVGLRCVIYLPGNYQARRTVEMRREGSEILRCPGDYETAVAVSSERARREGFYDANPGGDNTALQLQAYGQIAYEIYEELGDAPAVVAAPVSNGTTLAGIYRGFLSLYRRGKTSHMPRIVAGSSFRKNPIVRSYAAKAPACMDLAPHAIHETSVNEPLINWHSTDGDLALQAIRDTDGWAQDLSDRSMLHYARVLREEEGLHVLPAATAGLAAIIERHQEHALPGERYVAVVTGKK